MNTQTIAIIVCTLVGQSFVAKADCALGSYVSVIQQGANSHIGSPASDIGCQTIPQTARNNINPTNPNNAQREINIKPYQPPLVTVTSPVVTTTSTTQPVITPPTQSLISTSPSQSVITIPPVQPAVAIPTQPIVVATPTEPVVNVPPAQPVVTLPSPPMVTHPPHTVVLPEQAAISTPVGLSAVPNTPGADKGKTEGGKDAK